MKRSAQTLSKVSRYLGILLLAVGILGITWVPLDIRMNQTDCEGGLSPVPSQGCGYVPQLVMFGEGPASLYSFMMTALYLIWAGIAILLVGWLGNRMTTKPTSSS
jgi:hypothetical protein